MTYCTSKQVYNCKMLEEILRECHNNDNILTLSIYLFSEILKYFLVN